ncbi:hypothetical protein SCHPADRAFT_57522 [Schizopora paradoxa]|uniref:Uncharacterized protein n=1 Tax=Schizopora paradoxa TaxID=27342 RepID=A0A0H2SRL4_9AGAM|nr:hypothetical protein SCHPADRAFT_57522 [Schizopora paradoxa]
MIVVGPLHLDVVRGRHLAGVVIPPLPALHPGHARPRSVMVDVGVDARIRGVHPLLGRTMTVHGTTRQTEGIGSVHLVCATTMSHLADRHHHRVVWIGTCRWTVTDANATPALTGTGRGRHHVVSVETGLRLVTVSAGDDTRRSRARLEEVAARLHPRLEVMRSRGKARILARGLTIETAIGIGTMTDEDAEGRCATATALHDVTKGKGSYVRKCSCLSPSCVTKYVLSRILILPFI